MDIYPYTYTYVECNLIKSDINRSVTFTEIFVLILNFMCYSSATIINRNVLMTLHCPYAMAMNDILAYKDLSVMVQRLL